MDAQTVAAIAGVAVPVLSMSTALLTHRFRRPRLMMPARGVEIPHGLKTACRLVGEFYAARELPTIIDNASLGYRTSQMIFKIPPDVQTQKIQKTERDLEHFLIAKGIRLIKGSLTVEVSGLLYVSFTHTSKKPVLLSKLLRIDRPYDDSFIVGVTMQDEIFRLPINTGSYPHSLIVGSTGSGKTYLALTIAINAILLGWDTWILNPKKKPIDKDEVGLWSLSGANGTTYITDYGDMQPAMEKLAENMESLEKPTIVIADELADIVMANKPVANSLGRIAQRGRQYRLHLIAIVPKATKSVLVDDMLHANAATSLVGMRMNSRNLSMFGTGVGGLQLDRLAGEGHARVKLGSEVTEIQVAIPDHVDQFAKGNGSVYENNHLLPIVERWFKGIAIGGPCSKNSLRHYASRNGKGIGYEKVAEQFDKLVEMGRIDRPHDNVPGVKVK